MDLGLRGKCALVTGASKGLGKAIAAELAKEGAHVAICARGLEDIEQTAQTLRSSDVKVAAIQADVAKPEEVQRVIDTTIAALGRIDILVNNAGTAWLDHTLNTTDEQWHYCMEINLYSAVRFTRGRIINISTVSAHTPSPILPDYNSAKAAMLAFSKACSFELAPDGILVNCVCPALIRTPLWDNLADAMVPTMGKTVRKSFRISPINSWRLNASAARRRCLGSLLFWLRIGPHSSPVAYTTSMAASSNRFSKRALNSMN
jgi:3-oxoacyl-[acyl-carrier protein] reductase